MDINFTKDMKTVIKHLCEEEGYCMTCPFYNGYNCIAARYFEEKEAPCDWITD